MAASEPPVVLGYDLEPSPPCPLHYFTPPPPLGSLLDCALRQASTQAQQNKILISGTRGTFSVWKKMCNRVWTS